MFDGYIGLLSLVRKRQKVYGTEYNLGCVQHDDWSLPFASKKKGGTGILCR